MKLDPHNPFYLIAFALILALLTIIIAAILDRYSSDPRAGSKFLGIVQIISLAATCILSLISLLGG